MTAVWIVIALLVLVAVGVALLYNRFVRQRNLVDEAWRQIDVELHRRHDLIPNIVETVKGYAAHERETLDAVIRARGAAAAAGSSRAEQAQQEGALGQALGRLFALNDQWDARVQLLVNAVLAAAVTCLVAAIAVKLVAPRYRTIVLVAVTCSSCLPYAWENTTWAF